MVLLPLLEDSDVHVRMWAAAHALEFAPSEAEPVLASIGKLPGLAGLSARMTLQEWQKGRADG
jgi:hypothetical protein